MDTKRLLNAFMRKAWLVMILGLVGAGIGGYMALVGAVPMYQTSSSLFVMNRDKLIQTGQPLDNSDLMLGRQLAQDYSAIFRSHRVSEAVAKALHRPDISADVIRAVVSIEAQKDSPVLVVNAVWNDPETAALIANTTSTVFRDKVNELTGSSSVEILDEARTPRTPLPTKKTQQIAIGLLFGLFLGFCLVYLHALTDKTVRTVEDVENLLGMNIIGIIPEHSIR